MSLKQEERSRNREKAQIFYLNSQAGLICSATGFLKIVQSYLVSDIFNPNRHLPHPPTSERCSDFQKSSVIVDHPLGKKNLLLPFPCKLNLIKILHTNDAIKIRTETNTSSTRLPGSSKYPNYPIGSIRIR